MKRLLPIIFLGVLSLSIAANAWGFKIGYVDIRQVFDKCPYTKEATETLNREIEERNIKIRAYQKEIEKLKKELEGIPELGEGRIEEKKKLISQKEAELESFAEESGKRLIQKEQELTLEITEKIYEVVERIAKRRRIDIVLDKAGVLYGGENLDLTEEVIEEFKKEVKGEEKKKKKK